MNRIALLMSAALLSTGCASTTMIRSNPSGAKVTNRYGGVVCTTPCEYSDSEFGQHSESFTLQKEGYDQQSLRITRDNVNWGRAIGIGFGGLFFFPAWIAEGWAFDYDDEYSVELHPAEKQEPQPEPQPTPKAKVVSARSH